VISSEVFSIPLHISSDSKRLRDEATGPTLREFIGDDQNYLVPVAAATVLRRVSEYNPLVFYGSSGTGKSFLARGLVRLWSSRNNQRTAIITSGVDFAREYANAVDTDSITDLRGRYRTAALLLLDDLDGISEKSAAQGELRNTLDVLLENKSQILVTLKNTPVEVPGLEPGLASRLSGGLLVPFSSPGSLARRVILEQLFALYDLQVSDTAIDWILSEESSLSGPDFAKLHQLTLRLATAETESPLDVEAIQDLLGNQQPERRLSLRSISQRVSRYFDIRVSELKGPKRLKRVVRARGVAMLLSRLLTDCSLEQVGQHFGNRDHTTVLHACRKTESLVSSDPEIRQALEDLTRQLTTG
jgi:chromosomal replication initiator protein